MDLVLQLKDHRKTADSLKDIADATEDIGHKTAAQAAAVDLLTTSYQKLARAQNRVNKIAAQSTNLGGGGGTPGAGAGAGAGGGGGGTPGTGAPGSSDSYATGPWQRLARLTEQMASLQKAGAAADDPRLKDVGYALKNAQKHVERLENPPSRFDAIAQAVLSSRFGVGGGGLSIMPLIGRTLGALGITGAAAGPIGALTTAAGMAATAINQMVQETARVSAEFTRLSVVTGGSGAQTGFLRSAGISGSLSAAIGQRLSTDPVAMAYGGAMGAYAIPGPFGTINNAANTMRIVEGLRKMPAGYGRLRAMHNLGADDLAPLLSISGGTFDALKGDARTGAKIFDPAQQKRAAEFNIAASRVSQSMQNLWAALDGPVMEDMTRFMNTTANIINAMAAWFKDHAGVVEMFFNAWKMAVGSMLTMTGNPAGGALTGSALIGFSGGAQGASAGADDLSSVADAQTANTAALNANTQATDRLAANIGIIGGGQRARSAMPSAVGGWNLVTAVNQRALRQGAL